MDSSYSGYHFPYVFPSIYTLSCPTVVCPMLQSHAWNMSTSKDFRPAPCKQISTFARKMRASYHENHHLACLQPPSILSSSHPTIHLSLYNNTFSFRPFHMSSLHHLCERASHRASIHMLFLFSVPRPIFPFPLRPLYRTPTIPPHATMHVKMSRMSQNPRLTTKNSNNNINSRGH